MRLFMSLLFITFSTLTMASSQIVAQVYDIDHGTQDEETLIFVSTGQVLRLEDNNKQLKILEEAIKNHTWLSFTINSQGEIENIKKVSNPHQESKNKSQNVEDEFYEPTIFETLQQAHELFKTSRYVEKESQCYNRAHIWSYEWFVNQAVKSNKTWLFFTRKYIRKFKFEWWFHVSPSVKVMEDGELRERIMDVKYARSPLSVKRWTDIFMQNKASCPLVKSYSDYANYPESAWCFTMRTSMFYYQPYDIEMKEIWGIRRGNWTESDLVAAYLEAFDEEL